jgi:predicted DCC family thiol-disulfide oxidoreductase YuxK
MSPSRTVLLYDADCGFCRWATDRILRWDRAGRLRAVPLQSPEGVALLAPVPEARRPQSWHLAADGQVRSAGRAVAPLLRMLPGGRPLGALADSFPRATDAAYAWVARHRGRLGRIVGARACSVVPGARGS